MDIMYIILIFVLPPLATLLAVVIFIIQLGILKRAQRIEASLARIEAIVKEASA